MRGIFSYLINGIICIAIVIGYHFYGQNYLGVSDQYYSVDFRKLSDMKMAESLQQAKEGKPVKAEELQNFIVTVQNELRTLSNNKPVFVSNAFFNGNKDLTEELIKKLNLKENEMYKYIKETEIKDNAEKQ
jgi:hypothetical protein